MVIPLSFLTDSGRSRWQRESPSAFELPGQLLYDLTILCEIRNVRVLLGIRLAIVDFDGRDITRNSRDVIPETPFDVVVSGCDHRVAHISFAVRRHSGISVKLAEGGGFPLPFGIQQQRLETRPFHVIWNFDSRDVAESREDIDEFDESIATGSGGGYSRNANQQWHADIDVIVGLFAPTAVLTQFPTVVSPHNHDRVLVETSLSESGHEPAEASIDKTDRGIVAVLQPPGVLF